MRANLNQFYEGPTSDSLHGDTHTRWEFQSEVEDVLTLLENRSGSDADNTTAAEWAGDIQHRSDFINDMPEADFALLLEIVCKLPAKHPLRTHLADQVGGLL